MPPDVTVKVTPDATSRGPTVDAFSVAPMVVLSLNVCAFTRKIDEVIFCPDVGSNEFVLTDAAVTPVLPSCS